MLAIIINGTTASTAEPRKHEHFSTTAELHVHVRMLDIFEGVARHFPGMAKHKEFIYPWVHTGNFAEKKIYTTSSDNS